MDMVERVVAQVMTVLVPVVLGAAKIKVQLPVCHQKVNGRTRHRGIPDGILLPLKKEKARPKMGKQPMRFQNQK